MLQVEHLKKTFGDVKAVNDVSFQVADGSILGMIGRNGSGKTTIFRMILDFLTPEDGGRVLWNGQAMGSQLYELVGYLPEERGLYDKLTIEQQVLYFAELRGLPRSETSNRLDRWMDKFQVKGKRTDKINTLSKGNQQKVQLICTLIHEPKLIILDEPFSGLDPVNADLLQEGILELKQQGSAIIFSSHNMNNVQELCDSLVMIHNGDQVLSGTVHDVRESFGRTRIRIESPDWTVAQLQALAGVESVVSEGDQHYLLKLSDESYGPALFETITKGQYISMFNQLPPTLEEIFKMKAGGKDE